MLIGASQFSATALASPAYEGQDPRRLLKARFDVGGGFVVKLSMEYTLATSMTLGGELDAPFIRRKRTGVFMRGIFGQGANISVSPVQVTLDGGGGLVAAVNYIPGRIRTALEASGAVYPHANAHLHARILAQSGGGVFIRLAEYQKFRSRIEGGGGLNCGLSRQQYLKALFKAGGGVRISPWYDLIGEVDTVIAARVFVVVASVPRTKVTCVTAQDQEDTIVLEVGF